jgi:hypothetical protein
MKPLKERVWIEIRKGNEREEDLDIRGEKLYTVRD